MQAGEIYLARFPFGDKPGTKLRPVLVLTPPVGPVPEVAGACTTRGNAPEEDIRSPATQAGDHPRRLSRKKARGLGRWDAGRGEGQTSGLSAPLTGSSRQACRRGLRRAERLALHWT